MQQLLWLRSDLRVRDNTALLDAMAAGPTVVVFIATPAQWHAHDDAPIKIDFWRRNLIELKKRLGAHNVPLRLFQVPDYGAVEPLLREIIRVWKVGAIHFNREYPLNEWRRDEAVIRLGRELGVAVHARDDQVLLPPRSILNKAGQPFKVFTPYAREARRRLESVACNDSAGMRMPAVAARAPEPTRLAYEMALGKIDWPRAREQWAHLWPAGEGHAGKTLRTFAAGKIHDYCRQRDFPAKDATSALSPYLTAGVVSIRDCWRAACAAEPGDSVLAWQGELLWRDFYRYVMFHFPHVSKGQAWKLEYDRLRWRDDDESFQRWCEGLTGFPLIDAAMRQLRETGWMHNRLRMAAAMFLSKNLLLDWRRGESWFMRHLIDGDFPSNNGGWQWSASTGTDAAPYFRIFNPLRQSRRFDPEGEFIREYVPELSAAATAAIHNPERLDVAGYPAPIVDLKTSRQRAIETFRAI